MSSADSSKVASYGSIDKYFYELESNEEYEPSTTHKVAMNKLFFIGACFVFVTCLIAVVTYAPFSSSSILSVMMSRFFSATKESYWTATSQSIVKYKGLSPTPWKIYKHTLSANTGSNYYIQEFMANFVAYGSVLNLGCNSDRLLIQTAQNNYTAGEFHYVDSDVFFDSVEKPVSSWNNMITNLGFDTYNVYMNSYIQLYVDELTPVLDRIMEYGVTSYYTRISYTPLSSVANVAHFILYLDVGGSYIDIVAPLTSISDNYTSMFNTSWGEDECAGAHALKFELDAYSNLLAASTPVNVEWQNSTGLVSPLFISTGIPVTSLSLVDDVFTMVGTINNITETTAYFGDTCSYREMIVDAANDDIVIASTAVRYITHSTTEQGPDGYTLSDWEDLHVEIYDIQKERALTGAATWSRYLDTHMGIQSTTGMECEEGISLVDSAFDAIDSEYIVSPRTNLHFYTGLPGIFSWEFNARNCVGSEDTCGCIDCNSEITYFKLYGTSCT